MKFALATLATSLVLALPANADPLLALPVGSQWRVVSLAGEAQPEGADITLARPDAGTLGGTVICNQYSRPVTVVGETLAVGGLTTTKMLCDVAMFKYEMDFNSLLGGVDAVRATDSGIELLSGGAVVITAAQ